MSVCISDPVLRTIPRLMRNDQRVFQHQHDPRHRREEDVARGTWILVSRKHDEDNPQNHLNRERPPLPGHRDKAPHRLRLEPVLHGNQYARD